MAENPYDIFVLTLMYNSLKCKYLVIPTSCYFDDNKLGKLYFLISIMKDIYLGYPRAIFWFDINMNIEMVHDSQFIIHIHWKAT